MKRRGLACATAVVLAAHALVLLGLPRCSQAPAHRSEVLYLQTDMLAAQLPEPPPAAPAPPPAVAASRPASSLRPPRPQPVPQPVVEDTPAHAPPQPPVASLEPQAAEAALAAPLQETAATSPLPTAEATVAAEAAPPEAEARGMVVTPASGAAPADAASLPVRLPDPARLDFAVTGQAKGFHYSARAELTWRHADGRYQARQEVSLFLLGTRAQGSEGHVTDQGLVPERFTDQARRTQSAQLDFGGRVARFSDGAPDAPIAPGAQDRLSIFLQLAALLGAAPQHYAEGTQIAFTTVGARRADLWTFRVRGSETLELPAGDIAALRLDKLPRGGDDQRASLWLAPSLQYLPVRILLQQDSGDLVDLKLREKTAP